MSWKKNTFHLLLSVLWQNIGVFSHFGHSPQLFISDMKFPRAFFQGYFFWISIILHIQQVITWAWYHISYLKNLNHSYITRFQVWHLEEVLFGSLRFVYLNLARSPAYEWSRISTLSVSTLVLKSYGIWWVVNYISDNFQGQSRFLIGNNAIHWYLIQIFIWNTQL